VPFEIFIGAIGADRGEHVERPEPGLQEMMATCCKPAVAPQVLLWLTIYLSSRMKLI